MYYNVTLNTNQNKNTGNTKRYTKKEHPFCLFDDMLTRPWSYWANTVLRWKR